jgi:cytochrome c oxidase subunit 2
LSGHDVPRRRPPRVAATAALVAGAGLLAACGGEVPGGPVPANLSAAGLRGRQVALASGCAACHGGDFGGGVAPTWKGLAGRTVSLADGSAVVADTAYLTRAIAEPAAQIVQGSAIAMPANTLTAAQVADVVTFIQELVAPSA